MNDAADPIPAVTATDPAADSGDVVADNIATLKRLFPAVVADGKADFDVLRQLLGDAVEEGEERYGLTWKGKRRARAFALTPSLGTLRPSKKDSDDWDKTKNIVIVGENLEVLKQLRKSYTGRIKLVYIDPPYNTGNDFVYPDDYSDSVGNYERLMGHKNAHGAQLTSNKEVSGRFHTDWLNMMYPRLFLAKEMLSEDGTILVSCDDAEMARLKMLMDELFGDENFIAQIVWQRSSKGDAKLIANVHEYILCYARNKSAIIAQGVWRQPKEGAAEVLAHYEDMRRTYKNEHSEIRSAMQEWYRQLSNEDPRKAHKHYSWSDDRGLYFAADFAGPDDGRASRPRHDIMHPVTGRPCKKPSTGWRWDEQKTLWALEQNPPRIHFGVDETTIPNRKSYLFEIASEPYSSVFYRDGRSATLEVESLVGKGVFPFPKNTDVLAELIQLITADGDLVLDFFAGSGSTGHAVFKLNAEQKSKRRFVLVQIPESIESTDMPNIATVLQERLRRAGKKLRAEYPDADLDTGFRVYELSTSNLKPWQPDPDNLGRSLLDAIDNVLPGRTEDDLLVELLLKTGIDLSLPSEVRNISGANVYALGGGVLMVCLADIAEDQAEALGQGVCDWRAELDPPRATTFYFKDAGFASAATKANLAAIIRQRVGTGVEKLASL